jgi:hypothetical protein
MVQAFPAKPSGSSDRFAFEVIKSNLLAVSNFSKFYANKDIINYADREWRYVPKRPQIVLLKRSIRKEKIRLNSDYHRTSPGYLSFDVNDVNHIIVPSNTDVKTFIHKIATLRLFKDQKMQLIQKVTDFNTISQDF